MDIIGNIEKPWPHDWAYDDAEILSRLKERAIDCLDFEGFDDALSYLSDDESVTLNKILFDVFSRKESACNDLYYFLNDVVGERI
jgi:hypothetical protein